MLRAVITHSNPRWRRWIGMLGVAAVSVAVVAAMSVASSASGAATSNGCPANLSGKRVGIAAYDPSIPFYGTFWPNYQKQAKICGESITISNANGATLLQRQQAQQFISEGYNALVLDFADPTGWTQIVAQAKKKGMCVDNTSGAPITGAINTPLNQFAGGYAVGQNAAQWINKNLGGKAEVAMLTRPDNPAVG